MWEVVLTLCLASDPTVCREEVSAGGATEETCRARADALVAAAEDAPQSWPCRPVGEADPFPLTEVAEGVFVHKGVHEEANASNLGDVANLGVIIGEDAVAVIDAGGSDAVAEAFLAAIRRRTDLPIAWVILTHMHPDHSLGAGVFAAAGAKIIGHERLPQAFADRREFYLEANERLVGEAFAGTSGPDEIGRA
ncbi:MAG: MBL fold metallo-hydrolase, partial [Pseudomonadota bacterium]